jgi:hypothetical protein
MKIGDLRPAVYMGHRRSLADSGAVRLLRRAGSHLAGLGSLAFMGLAKRRID